MFYLLRISVAPCKCLKPNTFIYLEQGADIETADRDAYFLL